MDYLELTISIVPRNPWAEILTAELADLGFESFVDTEDGIQAYGLFKNIELESVVKKSSLSSENEGVHFEFTQKVIPHQNWNALWESDFHPVEVEEYLTIIAPFHSKENLKGMIVEIQPQMSFGTGHHQTTWLMSKALFELERIPESVLDMGTGTGVLAIIAEKLGAKTLVGIDIEDWTVINARENIERNTCQSIEILCGDVDLIEGRKFGLIIANINKNVLKSHIESYSRALEYGGILLLSGFFDSDVDELITFSNAHNLKMNKIYSKESWAGIKLIKEEN
jgi:ribosomal protein L11 methyltransferase